MGGKIFIEKKFGIMAKNRIKKTNNLLITNTYPYNNNFIILFGNQNYIRDGQHRAAILAKHGGLDKNIDVMVFHFKTDA